MRLHFPKCLPLAFWFIRLCLVFTPVVSLVVKAQVEQPSDAITGLYQQLQSQAADASVGLENVVLQRDRVKITFTAGILYLPHPAAGKIRSAVFIGHGTFQAAPPPVLFEEDNVRRLLKADDVSTDFKTAVFRFTDDTSDELLKGRVPSDNVVPEQASHLAHELGPRLLKETGMNVAARQLASILNQETPGIFLAQFDGGKRGRFTYLLDPQTRIPVTNFGINAGEKGLIFAYDEGLYSNDVWMAFFSEEEYAKGVATYADAYYLVDTEKYTLKLDVLEPKKWLGLTATLDLVSRVGALKVIPLAVGEGLSAYEDERRKRQLHVLGARLADGAPLTFFQEPWEGGFSLILPKPVPAGQHLSVTVDLRGEFMMESSTVSGTYFPRSSETWYPRHGYLTLSKFDIIVLHRKKERAVSIGELVREGPDSENKEVMLTQFRMEQPVPLATFAVAPYEIHRDKAKQESGTELPIEFYSMPGDRVAIKEDFILAEMNNCIRYFSKFFGEYPYSVFRAAYHPFAYGQGFPTTLMIPATDRADYRTYSFLAHETSHQWWGDQLLWRTYQDQWLSEGFAEYSGMLYVQFRDTKSQKDLIRHARESLKMPPGTLTGIGHGRLVDVGPLIMGHRVETRETGGAYSALTYEKGGLVLRMLHFLFTDPETGNGDAFVDLMRDFVARNRGYTVTTKDFFTVVNERVKSTPLARKYGYTDLSWFYRQWVLQSHLPSYELSYHVEDGPSGGALLKGELLQTGLPENEKWFMPLPLVIHFPGGKMARGTIAVLGDRNPINLRLPQRPDKVELDPEMWVLSDKTSTVKR
jgi:hypothetical protein